jgi:hypothetical protein
MTVFSLFFFLISGYVTKEREMTEKLQKMRTVGETLPNGGRETHTHTHTLAQKEKTARVRSIKSGDAEFSCDVGFWWGMNQGKCRQWRRKKRESAKETKMEASIM